MFGTVPVWTNVTGEPRKLGLLQGDGEKTIFKYDAKAADLPGIGIAYDPRRLGGQDIKWASDYAEPLHPIFMALVPLCDRTNLQYRIAAKVLRFTRDTPYKEWLMLPFLGHGSLGHLDVFDSDLKADEWYRGDAPVAIDLQGGEIVSLAIDALDSAHEAIAIDRIIEAIGRAPSPGGAMPKIMHRILWPGTGRPVDAIVKFERVDGNRPDLLLMEDWAYGVHERLGIKVPDRAFIRDDRGNHVLVTERFDRRDGRCVPLESFYSVLKSYDPERFPDAFTPVYGTEPSFEMVAHALHHPKSRMSEDVSTDSRDLYMRIVLSFLTGNGDLHLRNLSVLGRRGEARLSPVYDPAPMRLFGGLDMHTAVTFGGMRFHGEKLPDGFGRSLVDLGGAFKVVRPRIGRILDDALDATASALDEITLAGASPRTVEKFEALIAPVRASIEEAALTLVPRKPRRRPSVADVSAAEVATPAAGDPKRRHQPG